MILTSLNSRCVLVLVVCMAAAAAGCSKKKDATQGSTPRAAAPVEATEAPQAAPAGQAVSALSTADATKILNEANAALKAKDYEKAVEATLIAQRQRSLTEQQMAAMHNQMLQLQK